MMRKATRYLSRPGLAFSIPSRALRTAALGVILCLEVSAGPMAARSPAISGARGGPASAQRIGILVEDPVAGAPPSSLRVSGLTVEDLDIFSRVSLTNEQWQEIFAVYVLSQAGMRTVDSPPILGSYAVDRGGLEFKPRFPFQYGVRYRAVLFTGQLAIYLGDSGERYRLQNPVEKEFLVPRPSSSPTAIVQAIYPSSSRLPENQLKFYVHFSASMMRGDAYRHIRLLDGSGKDVDLPFLELDEELWDAEGKRITLFFDPGRIKRGVRPREEVGPALVEGESYTLVIDRAWRDSRGDPLKSSFEKKFSVGPPDNVRPEPEMWKIVPPPAGSLDALVVTFPEPLDHAMLLRVLTVRDAASVQIKGKALVDDSETRWAFVPTAPWGPGLFYLEVQTTLEDLAGNSIARLFEVDEFLSVDRHAEPDVLKLPFRVGARP